MKTFQLLKVHQGIIFFCFLSSFFICESAHAELRPPNLTLSNDDGSSSIRFQFAAQIRWAFDHTDEGPGLSPTNENSIFFRRLRNVISGSIATEGFTYKLHVSLLPGAIEVIDLWFDYRFHEHIALRLGQDKIPFTRYRLGSFQTRPVNDWSGPTRYFGAERQIGMMLHNNIGSPPRFEYQFGVYTGVNSRASNGIGMPIAYVEDVPNPSDLTDPAAPSTFHPELVVHFAYNAFGIKVKRPQDFEGGGPRFSLGTSIAWDARPTLGQDMALRIAPEAILKVHGLTLWAVFYLGMIEERMDSGSFDLGMLGAVAQVSYVFLGFAEVGLRYTNISLLQSLRQDARSYAQEQIDSAETEEQREELVERYSSIGLVTAEHELALGFNVYLFARSFKLGLDGGMTVYQRTDADRYDFFVRLQAQLGF